MSSLLLSGYSRRSLIRTLARREMAARYRGSALGRAWPAVGPLLMLAVFTFVFGAVFEARWPGQADAGLLSFALVLLAGLLVNTMMAEVVSGAPGTIIQHPNYVKKVVFPLETLAWVQLSVALTHCLAGFLLLFLANGLVGTGFHLSALAVPVLLLPFCLLLLGLAWFLSSLGVYLRDLSQLVPPVLTALMFLSPVFYPRSNVPDGMQVLLVLNPLTFPVEQIRAALFSGLWPDWAGWGWYLAASLLVHLMGLATFQKLRKGFADVV